MVKEVIKKEIEKALSTLNIVHEVNVEYQNNIKFGDYTCNVAMHISKKLYLNH